MLSETVIAIIQVEMERHRFDTYVEDPPSLALGGRGVVVPGCSICKVRLSTVGQFVDHLTKSVVQAINEAARQPAETAEAAEAALCNKISRGVVN
jgi:hypothetical protein